VSIRSGRRRQRVAPGGHRRGGDPAPAAWLVVLDCAQAIAAQYYVTTEMARFRVNRTGVRRQLRSPGSVTTSVHDEKAILPAR
jgi:hypothetical protein